MDLLLGVISHVQALNVPTGTCLVYSPVHDDTKRIKKPFSFNTLALPLQKADEEMKLTI